MTEKPPEMFRRPSDPPDPLPSLRGGEHMTRLHSEWARLHPAPGDTHAMAGRLRNRAGVVARIVSGADHRLLGDLVRAVDAVAARVDELSEQLTNLAITTDDLSRTLSEEVSRLRSQVPGVSPHGDLDAAPRDR